jgi:group I intron endonuclease
LLPVKIYENTDLDKLRILKENKAKAGVYRWTNLINGKSYIGSSINLERRLKEYFNINYLEFRKNMPICSALLKYGYSNFQLEILEYSTKHSKEAIAKLKDFSSLLSSFKIAQLEIIFLILQGINCLTAALPLFSGCILPVLYFHELLYSSLEANSMALLAIFPFLIRNYSSRKSVAASPAVVPVKIYSNVDLQKYQILKENKGKAGVYRWVNLLNKKSYIGSSVNLSSRLKNYFNIYYLERELKNTTMKIYRGLLKYGYSSFSLEILEYCAQKKAIEREQYYLDIYQPQYNILRKAGSLLGFKHSSETIAKFKVRSLTLEQKAKQLEKLKIYNSSQEHKDLLKRLAIKNKGRARPEGAGVPGVALEVFDTWDNKTSVYPSISECARALGMDISSIRKAFKRSSACGETSIFIKNKRYQITKLSN